MMKFRFGGKRRKNSSKVAFSSALPDWKYPAAIVSSYKSVSSPITVRLYGTPRTYLNSLAGPFRIELKILRKHTIWIKGNLCEINTYHFLIAWDKNPAQTCHSQNAGPKFPPPEEGEKRAGVGEKIRNLEKGLLWYTAGSIGYEATAEKIAKLKALL